MSRNAVVTGAGSGVGRAVALKLAARGWNVALIGRRPGPLLETSKLAKKKAARSFPYPCDIGDVREVEKVSAKILRRFKTVDVLVNAAGTNAPKRALSELSLKDYHRMMNTNLNGAYYCAQAFLPGMRRRGGGTIVNIVSDAAKQASAKAGPAYVMSKFGLAGLTQSINAEEKAAGIRACAVFPGDINTPLLNLRPNPPGEEIRAKMLQAEDIAACVLLAIELPSRAVVEEILVRPR